MTQSIKNKKGERTSPKKKKNNEAIKYNPILPPETVEGIINLQEETSKSLPQLSEFQKIANNNDAVLLAFIAPYAGERVSPIHQRSAAIDIFEEIGIGATLAKIYKKSKKRKNLFLLIDSPGGRVDSSYKVALALRKGFRNITVFIPRVSASGGTLLAMTGNELVMGDMAHLTPIDIQVPYKGDRVSVNTMEQAITRLEKYFSKILPAEAPYPYRAMTDKLDPILREDWSAYTEDIFKYVLEILKLDGYKNEDIRNIILNFIFHKYSHSFVINKERAKEYGLNISNRPEHLEVLELMSKWLGYYFPQKGKTHFIRYILPD